jgi:hypothetical protein
MTSASEPAGPAKSRPGRTAPSEQPVHPQGMIPGRGRRRTGFERVSMRLLATGGIIGIAVALGAILVSENVDGWIVGLTIGVTSVTLAAILWSSRQL